MEQLHWIAQPTARHEVHGQSAVYDEATGQDVAIIYNGRAHADLIAAAPDMLCALQHVLEVITGDQAAEFGVYDAISKAEGR